MNPKASSPQEDQDDYKKGGYHPVEIGDVFESRYQVIKKLGWGQFSTVWLCFDTTVSVYVALKISKSALFYSDAAASEMSVLQHINSRAGPKSFIVMLLNSFTHRGPNGRHFVLVFEILGINLLDAIKIYESRGLPISICKSFLIQILQGLDFLHRTCGVIHTDLKPENVLLELTRSQAKEMMTTGKVQTQLRRRQGATEDLPRTVARCNSERTIKKPLKKLLVKKKLPNSKRKVISEDCYFSDKLQIKIVDFGNAAFIDSLCNSQIQTRQYRAPEVILGAKFGPSADMWSFGCIAFELMTGELLFQPMAGDGFSEDEDHLASIWETLGEFPMDWANSTRLGWRFFSNDALIKVPVLHPYPLKAILTNRYGFKPALAEEFSVFLIRVLQVDPEARASAEDLLKHTWLNSTKKY